MLVGAQQRPGDLAPRAPSRVGSRALLAALTLQVVGAGARSLLPPPFTVLFLHVGLSLVPAVCPLPALAAAAIAPASEKTRRLVHTHSPCALRVAYRVADRFGWASQGTGRVGDVNLSPIKWKFMNDPRLQFPVTFLLLGG